MTRTVSRWIIASVLSLTLLASQRGTAEASPQPSIVINLVDSYSYTDGLGCTGYFYFTPDSGTGSKSVTVELQFDRGDGSGFQPAFHAKYLNGLETGQGQLVSIGSTAGFRARVVRNNGTPLTDWAMHSLQC